MERIIWALGDSARWRIVELLAERPRSVGELAELTRLRQPQATKHLQTLAKAGLVTVFPLGQRRVYAAEVGPLRELAQRVYELAETVEAHGGERDALARYRAAIAAETAAAEQDRWADGRMFSFQRTFAANPGTVWRYWTEQNLLARWWAPTPMRITECALEPRRGGRAVLEYRDPDGRDYRSEGRVREAKRGQRLAFELSVLDTGGAVAFTVHYVLTLTKTAEATRVRLDSTIADSTVDAVPAIAGIESGWEAVLDNLGEALAAGE